MKKCFTLFLIWAIILPAFSPGNGFARNSQNPSYRTSSCSYGNTGSNTIRSSNYSSFQLTISNDVQVSANILEFDLNILSLDTLTPFELSSVQTAITFNPAIINNGLVECVIKNNSSSLVVAQRPTTIQYNPGNFLIQLFPQPPPGPGGGTFISTTPQLPTRICRIRLSNTVPWASQQPDLGFVFQPSAFATEVSRYINTVNTLLTTDSSNSFSQATNNILNYPPPPLLPALFNMTGDSLVCPGDLPAFIGLDGSEVGTTYLVKKDGVVQEYLEGTGSPFSFECYMPGSYTIDGINAAGMVAMNGVINLQFFPEPTVNMVTPEGAICLGMPVTLQASVSNAGTSGNYYWWVQNASSNQLEMTTVPSFTYFPQSGDLVSVEYIQSDPCNYTAESGYIVLNVNPSSVGGNITGGGNIYFGESTGDLNLVNYSGTILKWQKCLNSGPWNDVPNASNQYSEIPSAAGQWSYRAIVRSYDCNPDTSSTAEIIVLDRSLTIKLFPQGYYNPVTQLVDPAYDGDLPMFQQDTADLVKVRLVNPQIPYNDLFVFGDIAISTTGLITIALPAFLTSSYYLVINHRNSIETWSSVPVSLSGPSINYNFTTGANKAYGFNQKKIGNAWVIYGGDVNQDGLVDSGDMIPIDNLTSSFSTGYLPEDVNGDGLTDSGDMIIVDNNSGNFVNAVFPYSQELPVVASMPVHSVTMTAATCNAEVISQGGSPVTERGVCLSKSQNPTLGDLVFQVNAGTGNYTIQMPGLDTATHYFLRAFAVNHSGVAYGHEFSFTTLSPGGGSPYSPLPLVTYGNQTYNTVKIGTQVWMRENLNAGTRINNGVLPADNDSIEKYCFGDMEINCNTYGGLYDWEEMMQYDKYQSTRGICPVGWHLPSNYEWVDLRNYLGGRPVAGGKLKERGSRHWGDMNLGSNESGFSALPSESSGMTGTWFTSSLCDPGTPESRVIWAYDDYLGEHIGCSKTNFMGPMSVRCLLDDSLTLASVTTTPVFNLTSQPVMCGGEIKPDGGTAVFSRGVCWGLSQNPTIQGDHTTDGEGYGVFHSSLTGLQPDTVYYVRAYAVNTAGVAYGQQRYFSTSEFGIPCPGLDSIVYEGKSYRTVQIGNQCWMKDNLNVGTRINGNLNQTDNATIEKYCYLDLESNCEIYGGLYQWGEAMEYINAQGVTGICPEGWHIPLIEEWSALSDFLGGSAISGGKLKEYGTAKWREPNAGGTNASGFSAYPAGMRSWRNISWSGTYFLGNEYQAQFWSSSLLFDYLPISAGLVSYYESLSEMNMEDEGISIRCLKNDTMQLALIQTAPVSKVLTTSAQCGGMVQYQGGSPVTGRGVCYDTIPGPSILDLHTIDGSGTGTFVSNLTGLIPGITYFARAYSTNTGGTSYGAEVSFTTCETVNLAVSTTDPVTEVTYTSATSGGEVLDDGCAEIFAKGVCWSTNPVPTILDSHTSDGSGPGSFVSHIMGLLPASIYYVRSYVTNSVGTSYGNEEMFITMSNSNPFYLGQVYEGGIIFYIDNTGQHGLIAAPFDQEMGPWGCLGTSVPGTSTYLGSGKANTNLILFSCYEEGTAADICDDLELDGFFDWYLPSKDELNQLYFRKFIVGGFSSDSYWTSSQTTGYNAPYSAWLQFFETGYQEASYNKYESHRVRAIRSF